MFWNPQKKGICPGPGIISFPWSANIKLINQNPGWMLLFLIYLSHFFMYHLSRFFLLFSWKEIDEKKREEEKSWKKILSNLPCMIFYSIVLHFKNSIQRLIVMCNNFGITKVRVSKHFKIFGAWFRKGSKCWFLFHVYISII